MLDPIECPGMFGRAIGQELASRADFLMHRANEELAVDMKPSPRTEKLAALYVAAFGIPEIGVYARINRVLARMPADVGRVVDLGCGPGMLLGAIHKRKRYQELVGVEIEPAAATVATQAHPYARIIRADVCSL